MKARLPALTALLLAALPLGIGQAQEPRRLELAYEVTVAGVSGLRLEIRAQFSESGYEIESRTFKVGALRALTPRYDGFNRAWGRFDRDVPLAPGGGTLSVTASDQKRTWQVRYGAGGALQETQDPPWHPAPGQAIGESDRGGSLDPLTAILSVGMRGDAACEQNIATFDGRRRIDVLLLKIATETKGDVLVCEARLRRVAGEFADAGSANSAERPARLWFARLESRPLRYPIRLEAQAGLGVVRGRLVHISEQPLTPVEKTAMAH